MLYGKSDRRIDMLQALEQFISVRAQGQGQGQVQVQGQNQAQQQAQTKGGENGGVGDAASDRMNVASARRPQLQQQELRGQHEQHQMVRDSLFFFFSDEGALLRELVMDEISSGIDALSRGALYELLARLAALGFEFNSGSGPSPGLGLQEVYVAAMPRLLKALAPPLSLRDQQQVESLVKLVSFLTSRTAGVGEVAGVGAEGSNGVMQGTTSIQSLTALLSPAKVLSVLRSPLSVRNVLSFGTQLQGFSPNIRDFVPHRAETCNHRKQSDF